MLKSALIGLLLFYLCLALPGQTVLATSAEDVMDTAGLALAVEPPQASAEALFKLPTIYVMPGTISYWFKSLWEDLQYMLATTPEKRTELLLDFSRKRLAEGMQAVQDGKPQAAVTALTKYQEDQSELAGYLSNLQDNQTDMADYLRMLTEQLQIQQALQQFVEQEVDDQQTSARITSLLYLQPNQTLVFAREYDRVVLGQKSQRQPGQATPSASQSATPSATPQPTNN